MKGGQRIGISATFLEIKLYGGLSWPFSCIGDQLFSYYEIQRL